MTGPFRWIWTTRLALSFLGVALFWHGTSPAAEAESGRFVRLEVTPQRLTLEDVRDARRVLVTGVDAQGKAADLTHQARYTALGTQIRVAEDGFVVPVEKGSAKLRVEAGGLTIEVPVDVKDVSPKPVSFVRDVVPVLTKVGCNAGTCHGAAKGKNGFKLSLRGYDPLFDYRALIDDVSGRRFNRAVPNQSLMLLKPTQGVPHEGGFLFDEGSRYYALIEQWIAEGCRYKEDTRVSRLEVFPADVMLSQPGQTQQLLVIAHFPDGSTRDVTRDASYETSNFEVATLGKQGLVSAVRRGEAAALIRYEGQFASVPVMVIGDREGYAWNDSPEFNYIDTLVNAKLKRMKILPSELCTDAEFLRRVSIDLTGAPPTAGEVRAFLNDPRPSREKRLAKIEELLDSAGYVDYWTLKWSDLLLSNRKFLTEKGVWAFRNWIRNAIATNMPYDRFAYELMTASGSTFENPAANYFRVAREPKVVMENMTQVFLGTRFMCAQCHDHPFERWTQTQYHQLSAFFAGVGRKKGPQKDEEIIFDLPRPQPIVNPRTGETVQATFPFTHAGRIDKSANLREQLAEWLTAPENPYFARSLVNRYWSYFTGRGFIDPVDDIRSSNPPTNPELLDALTEDFIKSGFDLKHLVRTIVSSHTYQRSHLTNRWNEDDEINYSHAIPRRLTAEQLFDAVMVATGAPTRLPGVPPGFRATQLPDPNVKVSFLDMFGRAPRESPCECERTSEISLGQTLNLINGSTIAEAIAHPQGLIAQLVQRKATPAEMVEEIYLAALCRLPTDDERKAGEAYFAEVGNPREAGEDLMWALINSPAFLFNR